MGERIKMRDFVVTAGLLFLFFTFTLSEESDDTERAGKIFYVTTTSSISTVSTATFCFVQATQSYIPLTCGKKKRKKRAVKVISDKSAEDLDIHPSSIYPEEDNEEIESEVMSSQGEERKGKFVNYWTTTFTSTTTTSYTSTLSTATVECTPVGWTYVQCPAGKK